MLKKYLLLIIAITFFAQAVLSVNFEWWNVSWHYRIYVEVNASSYNRIDYPVELLINFSKEVNNFDNKSIRVIEYDSNGNVLWEVPSQFYPSEDYNENNSVGEVIWILNGTTPANAKRYFFIYFDTIENGKSAANYPSAFNYSFENGMIDINSSKLELRINTNGSEYTSGLSYAKRKDSNSVIFDIPSTGKTFEYLYYINGSTELGFDLRNNVKIVPGPVRLTIVQEGDEIYWNSLTKTNEGRIRKIYYIYPNKEWIKVKQIFVNNASYSITRSSPLSLRLDVDRSGLADSITGSSTDPYSWQSSYSNLNKGVGIINLNESVSNFVAQSSLIGSFFSIGIELSQISLNPNSEIKQVSAIYFNNESNHSNVENLRNKFANDIVISRNASESYSVILNGFSDETIYNRGEMAIFTANISKDDRNFTRYVNLTLDMGTSSSSDDSIIALYDDGNHNDGNANDGIYANTYVFPLNSNIGVWNAMVKAYDGRGDFLNSTLIAFNITNVLNANLTIENPSGVVSRVIYANLNLRNYRNDSYLSNANLNCSFNSTYVSNVQDLNNGTYAINFTAPSIPEKYLLYCSVEWNNNTDSDSEWFETLSPNVSLNLTVNPLKVNVSNITQTSSENFTLSVNVSNYEKGIAVDVNITLNLPENWTSFPEYFFCGNLSEGDSCSKDFNVTVGKKTLAGLYNVTVNAKWTNLDNSDGDVNRSVEVNVKSNKLMVVVESNVSGVVNEGSYSFIGNLTIKSEGNDNITNVSIVCSLGVVCENMTVNFSRDFFSYIAPGNMEIVGINVSVPEGFPSGNYTGIINVSSDNGYKEINISVEVPKSYEWTLSRNSCNAVVIVNSTGELCVFSIRNNGNKGINFTINPDSANGTSLNITSFSLNSQEEISILVTYNTTGLAQGEYNASYVINSTGNPQSRLFTTSLNVVVGPVLTDNTSKFSEQMDILQIKVFVDDLSNSGIKGVNVSIVKPDNSVVYLNLTNLTSNVPGSTSLWGVNYTPDLRGNYNITFYAIDNQNGLSSLSSNFTVFAKLNVSLSTNWIDFFKGEIPSVNYYVSDGIGNSLDANVTLKVYDSSGRIIYLTNKIAKNGVFDIIPTFQIPTDGFAGNYTLNSLTTFYDGLANKTISKEVNYTFMVHKKIYMEVETSHVWYENNVLQIYILLYGDEYVLDEINSSDVKLEVYDPAANLWFSSSKDNFTVVNYDNKSVLYLYQYAIPSNPSLGMYLIKAKLEQGSRDKFKLKSFRISSGGPFDLVIERIDSEVSRNSDLNFRVRLENKGEVSMDVYLDYWITDENNVTYDKVEGEAVFVAANSNRSIDRSLFIYSDQPLGNYTLHVKLNYSPIQPVIEASRTFKVVEGNVTEIVPEVAAKRGGKKVIPEVSAAEIKYEMTITKIFPEVIDIERGGIRYLTIEVLNSGNQEIKDIEVLLDGIPSNWYSSNEIESLKEGESKILLVKISVPPDVERSTKDVTVKVIGDKAMDERKIRINVFESKEELINSIISNTEKMLGNVEERVENVGRDKVGEIVKMLEQVNELIKLAKKNLEEKNLLKALDYAEKARNLLDQANFFLSIQKKEEKVVVRFPWPKSMGYIAIILLGMIASVLIVNTFNMVRDRMEIRKIKKAVLPKIKVERRGVEYKMGIEMRKEREEELEEMMELIKRQHQMGLISNETFMELMNRYQREKYYARIKTCRNCGFVNEEDAYYCVNCGKKLSGGLL